MYHSAASADGLLLAPPAAMFSPHIKGEWRQTQRAAQAAASEASEASQLSGWALWLARYELCTSRIAWMVDAGQAVEVEVDLVGGDVLGYVA